MPGIAVLIVAGGVRAQDLAHGQAVAQVWCSNCHRIGPAQPAIREPAPSFLEIAGRDSTTEKSLAAFLSAPHGAMPDLTLSRKEIRDVSAYILRLRGSP